MADVTQILADIESGDGGAAEQLLPLVYSELRRLASQKMAGESPGQTLQPTALVHEAYMRLVDVDQAQHWNSRRHFFSAAAEAMQRILVEIARRKQRAKHGGNFKRVEYDDGGLTVDSSPQELLALSDALSLLAEDDPTSAEIVKLRLFATLSVEEAGELMGQSRATAYRHWTFARAWLRAQISSREKSDPK